MWKQTLKSRLRQSGKTFSQAWTACALCMVQGDLSVFTWHHAETAASTGIYSALGVLLVLHIRPESSKWFIAWATGVVTMFADRLIHSTHFGGSMTEAIATGIGAFMLAVIFDCIRSEDD